MNSSFQIFFGSILSSISISLGIKNLTQHEKLSLSIFLIYLHHLSCNLSKLCFRAIRHPASGYVQGINDLVTPFLIVFLEEHLEGNMESWNISQLSPQTISNIEADCYWCLSKLLDGMQDHYTFAQPGIQRLVFKLKELVRRIDGIYWISLVLVLLNLRPSTCLCSTPSLSLFAISFLLFLLGINWQNEVTNVFI